MGITSEHVLIIKVSIIHQIRPSVRRTARLNQSVALGRLGWTDPAAPAAASVRAQPTHLSKKSGRAEKKAASSERFRAAGCTPAL